MLGSSQSPNLDALQKPSLFPSKFALSKVDIVRRRFRVLPALLFLPSVELLSLIYHKYIPTVKSHKVTVLTYDQMHFLPPRQSQNHGEHFWPLKFSLRCSGW